MNREVEELKEQVQKMADQVHSLESKMHNLLLIRNAPNKDFLTVEEVAQWLGCSTSKVRKHEREGLIPARFPNAKRRFASDEVNRFMRGFVISQKIRSH